MKKEIIVSLIFLILFINLINAEMTSSSDKTCNKNICNLILYSGIRFVYEDNQWKKVEEAKSLMNKGFNITYLEIDENYPIEVIDFNYTSIKVKLNPSGIKFYEDVPIRIWERNKSKDKSNYKESHDKIFEENINFNLLSQSKEITYNFKIGNILEFGKNSTTIILQDADTENLEDTWINENSGAVNSGTDDVLQIENVTDYNRNSMIKFNISQIPNSVNITSAFLSLNLVINGLDSSTEGWNVSVHHFFNQSWIETYYTWNNKPTDYNSTFTDTKYFFGGTGEPIGFQDFNVNNSVNIEYSLGNKNISFYLKGHDMFGSPSATDNLQFASKENADTTIRPFLNITYISNILDTISPYFTNSTPVNQTIVYNVALNYDINASDETGFSCFAVNDSRFKIDCNGLLQNNSMLGVNLYYLNITINDTSNNLNSTIMWVNITKANPLGTLNNQTLLTLEYPNPFNWTYSETNNGDSDLIYKIYRNGIDVSSEASQNIILGAGTWN